MKKRGGTNSNQDLEKKNTFRETLRLAIIGALIACVGMSLHSAAKDEHAPTGNLFFYLGLTGLPFLVAWALALKDGPWMSIPFSQSFARNAAIALMGIGMLVYVSRTWGPAATFLHLATYASLFLFAIFALAMVFNMFSNFFLRQGGFMGFLIRLVFYLPCVALDVVQTLHGELKSSPKTLWILLALEVLAIGVYFSSTQWLRYLHQMHLPGSITLLQGPEFFDKPRKFATVYDVTSQNDIMATSHVQSSYSIAMWIMMNPDTANFSERTIVDLFTYGNTTNDKTTTYGYHPALRYARRSNKDAGNTFWLQKTNSSTNRTNPEDHYAFQLPLQRWNFLVFTYQEGNLELFINGELHRTFTGVIFNKLSPQDVFVIGSTDGSKDAYGTKNDDPANKGKGVDGAIANVQYFQTPLTRTQVANLYNFRVSQPTVAWDPLVHRATML